MFLDEAMYIEPGRDSGFWGGCGDMASWGGGGGRCGGGALWATGRGGGPSTSMPSYASSTEPCLKGGRTSGLDGDSNRTWERCDGRCCNVGRIGPLSWNWGGMTAVGRSGSCPTGAGCEGGPGWFLDGPGCCWCAPGVVTWDTGCDREGVFLSFPVSVGAGTVGGKDGAPGA